MAFTKIVGAGIHTLSNVHTHNINSSGIITATNFVGPLDGTTGDFSGNVTIDGNLTVNGTTTTLDTNLIDVDKIEVTTAGNNVAVAITHNGSGDLVKLYDGSTQVVTVDDEGQVGIGTNVPQNKLHVVTTISNAIPLLLERTHTNNTVIEYKNSTSSMYAGLAGNALGWGVGSNADISSTANNKLMVRRDTGYIGINFPDPTAHLHIGNLLTGIGNTNIMRFTRDDGVLLYGIDYAGAVSDVNEVKFVANNKIFVFKNNGNEGESARITNTGLVGINEAYNINGRLHVQHDALSENILYATRYNDQGNDKPILGITEAQMSGMTSSGLVIGNHNRDIHIGQAYGADATVNTGYNSGIRLTYNGKVGIGSVSPGQKLDVVGNILTRSGDNTAQFQYNAVKFQTSGGAHIDHETTNQNLNFRVTKSSTSDTTMVQINAASEQTKFRKIITVGLQGGGDTTQIGGGAGIGAYLQLNYANNNIVNTKLMGNNTSWLNSHYGNLGIGTQTADEKFQVRTGTNKFISFTDAEHGSLSDLGSAIIFSRPSNGAKKICGIFQHTNQSLAIAARDDLTIHTGGDAFYYSGTERLRIASDGDVIIGNSSPVAGKLEVNTGTEVNGDAEYYGQDFAINIRANRGESPNDEGNGICFSQKWYNGSSDLVRTGAIVGYKVAGDGGFGGGLIFKTQENGANPMSERLRIDSDGDVIIGATSWQYKKPLNVQGSSGHILSLYNGDTGTYAADTLSGIELKLLTGNTGNQFGSCEIRAFKENGTNGDNARALSFYTGVNGGSPNERLRISSDGQVAVNYSAHHTSSSGILAANATTSGKFGYKAIEIGAAISSGTDQGALIVGRRRLASSIPTALLGCWDDGTNVTLYHGGGWSTWSGSATKHNFYTNDYTTSDSSGSVRLTIGKEGQIYLNNRDGNNSSHKGNIIAYAPTTGRFAYKAIEIGALNPVANDNGGLIVAQRKGSTAYPFALMGGWDNGSVCNIYYGGGWGSQSANATHHKFYTGSYESSGGSNGTERFRMISNGKIITNEATVDPVSDFEVRRANNGGDVSIRIGNNTGTNSGSTASLYFTTSPTQDFNTSYITAVRDGGKLNFGYHTNSPTVCMRVSTRHVGINTDNPLYPLSIHATQNDTNNLQWARFEEKTNGDGKQAFGLVITSNARNSSGLEPTAYLKLEARPTSLNGSHGGNGIIAFSPIGVTQGTYGSGHLDFYVRTGGPYTFDNDPGNVGEMTPRVRIEGGHSVPTLLIGQTSSNADANGWTLRGGINSSSCKFTSTDVRTMLDFTSYYSTNSQQSKIYFETTGKIYARTTSIQPYSSERRTKKNIVALDLTKAWNTLRDTPFYTFNFKDEIEGTALHHGPIVDECPEDLILPTQEEDEVGIINTVNSEKLQYRAYSALQQALKRIETLEAEVAALKGS